jgi:hypothetical protein
MLRLLILQVAGEGFTLQGGVDPTATLMAEFTRLSALILYIGHEKAGGVQSRRAKRASKSTPLPDRHSLASFVLPLRECNRSAAWQVVR